MTPAELAIKWSTDPIAGIADQISHGVVPADLTAKLFNVEAYRVVFTWVIGWVQAFLPVLVAILVSTILLIATNAGLLGISRLAFSLSRFKLIPEIMGRVHSRFKTPYFSLVLFTSVAIMLQSPGFFVPNMYANLGGLYAFGSMIAFALAHASILALRIKQPDAERPFKLGWNIKVKGYFLPVTAILGLIGTIIIWITVVIMLPYSRWVGFAWIAVGIVIYWYTHRYKKSEPESAAGDIEMVSG